MRLRNSRWALALAGAMAGATAAAQTNDALTSTLSEARALIDQDKAQVAIDVLKRKGAASDPRVAHLLGVAYFHANDPAKAIEALGSVVDKLAEGSSERREAVQVLGLANYLAGRIPESIPYLEETRAVAPDNAELAHALGMAYIQTNQASKAREAWARAFGVPPDSATAHLVAAQMMIRAQFDEMAEAELRSAIAKDPRLPQARFLLGQSALFRGRTDEAVTLFKEELALNPASAMTLGRLGDAYIRQGRSDDAVTVLQRSIWLNPFFSEPYILLGRAHLMKDRPATAEGLLRKAVEYDPNNKAAHYLLAQALQRMGRTEEAKAEFLAAERLPGPAQR